jgi:hypothetical protein
MVLEERHRRVVVVTGDLEVAGDGHVGACPGGAASSNARADSS